MKALAKVEKGWYYGVTPKGKEHEMKKIVYAVWCHDSLNSYGCYDTMEEATMVARMYAAFGAYVKVIRR